MGSPKLWKGKDLEACQARASVSRGLSAKTPSAQLSLLSVQSRILSRSPSQALPWAGLGWESPRRVVLWEN